jgi:hypothetical protein
VGTRIAKTTVQNKNFLQKNNLRVLIEESSKREKENIAL